MRVLDQIIIMQIDCARHFPIVNMNAVYNDAKGNGFVEQSFENFSEF